MAQHEPSMSCGRDACYASLRPATSRMRYRGPARGGSSGRAIVVSSSLLEDYLGNASPLLNVTCFNTFCVLGLEFIPG